MFKIQKIDELWGIVKKYYHAPKDMPVRKCEVKLTMPHHNSHIVCEYGDGDTGGASKLSFEDVCKLYDELKAHGIANISQTQGIAFTLEEGKPVLVTQSYYV